jgi:GH18 family chitinase
MKSPFKFLSHRILVALTICAFAFQYSPAQNYVVGYLPTWNNFPGNIQNVNLDIVTHLDLAFVNPNINGDIGMPAGLNTVVNAAHAKNVKVLVSLGGAGPDVNVYKTIMGNATRMNQLVQSLSQAVTANNLDGVDVDLEGDILDGNTVTATQYEAFVVALGTELHGKNKLLTAALGNWFANQVTATAASQFDFIGIMAYDATGSWSGPGQHSSFDYMVSALELWKNKGVPSSKLVVGVPFYGYGWGSYQGSYSYAELVRNNPGAENQDQIGSGANVIYYNGLATIRKKAEYLHSNTAGIMIWELTQDASGPLSLLGEIGQVYIKETLAPYLGAPVSIPGLVQAENYDKGGEGVSYHDVDGANTLGAYRSDGVDLETCTDTGAGYNVGAIQAGEWLAYSIQVTQSGTYNMEMRVAALVPGLSFHIEIDDVDVTGLLQVPNTGDWQTWKSVKANNVTLKVGLARMKVVMDSGTFNLNHINISTSSPTKAPGSPRVHRLHGTTQLYDLKGRAP